MDFRYENAVMVVKETLRMMGELVTAAQPNDTEVKKYADELRPALHSLQQRISDPEPAQDGRSIAATTTTLPKSSTTVAFSKLTTLDFTASSDPPGQRVTRTAHSLLRCEPIFALQGSLS